MTDAYSRRRPTKQEISVMLTELIASMHRAAHSMRQHPGLMRMHGQELYRAAKIVESWVDGLTTEKEG